MIKNKQANPCGFACLNENFPERVDIYASTAGVTAVAGISSLLVKRHLTLLRLLAERALRRFSSMGLSKVRRRRISSRIPSVSSLVLRRLRARSIGSPLRTVTERMIFSDFVDNVRERAGRIQHPPQSVKNFHMNSAIFFKFVGKGREKRVKFKCLLDYGKLYA